MEIKRLNSGFTLLELLVVVSIITLMSSVALVTANDAQEKAYDARMLLEFKQIYNAMALYYDDHGTYPVDADRNTLPAGLAPYLPNWPAGPWPGTYYDWDNWTDLDYPGQQILQISLRFCNLDGTNCHFPNVSWDKNFGIYSGVYMCISGACRAHKIEPIDYPGICVNCGGAQILFNFESLFS